MNMRHVPSGVIDVARYKIGVGDLHWLLKLQLISTSDVVRYLNIRAGEGGKWDDLFFLSLRDVGRLADELQVMSRSDVGPTVFQNEVAPAAAVLEWANQVEDDQEFFQRVCDIWAGLNRPDWLQRYLPYMPPDGANPFENGFTVARSSLLAEAKGHLESADRLEGAA